MSPPTDRRVHKDEQVAAAFTEAEFELLGRVSPKAGVPVAEWLRATALAAVSSPPAGRDFAPGEGVRRHAVIVRMTTAQRALVEAAAAKFGKRMTSAFIRAAALAEAKRLGVK